MQSTAVLLSQRKGCRWICIMLMLCLLIPHMSVADEALPAAPHRNQIVRVWLSRMGITDRLDVTLASPYLLVTESGTEISFPAGSQIAFLLRNEAIYVYHDQVAMSAGKDIGLYRVAAGDDGHYGFYRTNFPALYMGDLTLDIEQNRLRPILSIHVEDYLLGVIPYEMSESFPVEALKAQAVAARTYALRKQNEERSYDLVDTTNDQVFKGYIPGNPNSERAVLETRGVCGFYHGKLAQCYYSASNGGQMELVQTVWQTQEDYGYYTFGEDPYDVENPESVVRSFEIPKEYTSEAPLVLRQMVAQRFAEELTAKGMDPTPESIRIDRVSAAELSMPSAQGSKLMTQLSFRMNISTRTKREVIPEVDLNGEEVTLFAETQTAKPTIKPAVPAVPQIVYGSFIAFPDEIVMTIPVFPVAQSAFGMDISSNYDNEIWSVRETEDSFVLEARRYGHGVGMSQRGAQWMAAEHRKTYRDILSFYYPGMSLMRYPQQEISFTQPEAPLLDDVGPAPSPTPRPTLMPVSFVPEEGQWIAVVTGISDNSSLNLRSEPSLNGEILMRIYKNQQLLVLEQCAEEGWVKVKTDSVEGYVMESYLSRKE